MRPLRVGTRAVVLCGVLVVAVACAPDPGISDTGVTGAWTRGNDRNTSMVMIRERDGGYDFRWLAWSVDGTWKVECDWDGHCEETVGGALFAEHRFETRWDPRREVLIVEGDVTAHRPKEATAHFIDEVTVEEDGLTLWSYTVERDGRTYEGEFRPKRSFRKVSDDPEAAAR